MTRKTILSNGIKIVSKKMAHVRSVSIGVWVDVGARDESEAQSGLSHFIEHMIFKGTARRSAYEIAKAFDAIGGQTNAFTSMENTCYHARVMDTHLDTTVEILSDIFLNSIFDPEEVERERAVILQEIGMVEDAPEEYVHLLAGRNFWGAHPLGRPILGCRENVLSFSAADIKDYFLRFYQPRRIVISVAGNVDHDRFVDAMAPAFEKIRNGRHLLERIAPKVRPETSSHTRPIEQVHLCLSALGLGVTDPRRFACVLLNTILGGNMSSRLFQEIRERRGLAYSVYSFVMSNVDSGLFGVYAGIGPGNVPQAVDLVLEAIHGLQRTPVTADELQDAKNFTKGNLLLAAESVDNQMVRLAQNEIHFNAYIPLQTVLENIDAVTPEAIQSLAASLFRADERCLTLLGPLEPSP